ncbi:hypothetical protein BDF14DRAFT_1867331 [Spinellus fusiger]|nr:hypothetical protein BDF14DRAFT_1867331 [Spinellus fusiger]
MFLIITSVILVISTIITTTADLLKGRTKHPSLSTCLVHIRRFFPFTSEAIVTNNRMTDDKVIPSLSFTFVLRSLVLVNLNSNIRVLSWLAVFIYSLYDPIY